MDERKISTMYINNVLLQVGDYTLRKYPSGKSKENTDIYHDHDDNHYMKDHVITLFSRSYHEMVDLMGPTNLALHRGGQPDLQVFGWIFYLLYKRKFRFYAAESKELVYIVPTDSTTMSWLNTRWYILCDERYLSHTLTVFEHTRGLIWQKK